LGQKDSNVLERNLEENRSSATRLSEPPVPMVPWDYVNKASIH